MGTESHSHEKCHDTVDAGSFTGQEPLGKHATPPEGRTGSNRQLIKLSACLIFLLLLGAAWRWTPLSEYATPERLSFFFSQFDRSPAGAGAILLIVVIANLLMVPLSVLTVVCALLLGPWLGFFCAMAGALFSALLAFLIGQSLGGELIERFSGSTVHTLSKKLSERGVMTVAILRMLPVAPYTIVNLVAGVSHLRLGTFMLGSALGLVPVLAALTAFSGTLLQLINNPGAKSLAVFVLLAVAILILTLVARRILKRRRPVGD